MNNGSFRIDLCPRLPSAAMRLNEFWINASNISGPCVSMSSIMCIMLSVAVAYVEAHQRSADKDPRVNLAVERTGRIRGSCPENVGARHFSQ